MNINLNFISKYRQAFMGLAIFWIFFYHTGIDIPGLREFFALGWIGVDIFFFVSGYGLCASLSKNNSIRDFFSRRFIRIIPTWWTILAAMAVVGTAAQLKGFPQSPVDYFYWFSGLGWWTGNCNYEWYIPTLIVFYLSAPLFARLSIKTLAILTGTFMIIAIILGYYHIFQHVYMSYSRIPVYIFGFLVFKIQAEKPLIKGKLLPPPACIGLIIFTLGFVIKATDISWGLTIARVSIPLFIVPMLYAISHLIALNRQTETILSFLGTISLEIYLLHINHEFSEFIEGTLLSGIHSYFIKLTWFAIVVSCALLIHQCLNKKRIFQFNQ